ncbi:hypothetical protein DH2020_019685 [Rehmannia glutinosa]|uniref:Inositol polyphosphate-related phosphatase domain-containing protein n=1 Tax=Rehmannia glutinosa TaxID=99300 RepID=A0ABR0WGT7_REHGL
MLVGVGLGRCTSCWHDVQKESRKPLPRLVWLLINKKKSFDYVYPRTHKSLFSQYEEAEHQKPQPAGREISDLPRESRFKNEKPGEVQVDANDALSRLRRRRKSETFRAQYINTKEISLQEIIPLNAGNIFGAEDSRPVSKWENLIRETLNRVPPVTKFKSFSDPPSPSRFKPPEDALDIEDEIVLESDSDVEEEIYPLNDESNVFEEIKDGMVKGENSFFADTSVSDGYDNLSNSVEQELKRQFSSQRKLDRLTCSRTEDSEENSEFLNTQYTNKLTKSLSGTERIGLSWPEPPLHLLAQHVFERPNSFKSSKSFKASKSFKGPKSVKASKSFKTSKSFMTYSSFKSNTITENRMQFDLASLAEIDLESLINRKRRPPYVRIVSKQMVGIFITVWVRRNLRRHIQNVNVSTVGVGVMGYIGNKTLFCFVCSHLTSGEKEGDAVKRNADVHEIHRRTRFNSLAALKLINELPKWIPFSQALYTTNILNRAPLNWIESIEVLMRELRKGRAFDGWSEGTLNFAPTYKYEFNSESYCGADPKTGRRTPAWCDRILSFGTGMKLLSYRRSELKLSDHRPVTASYMVEIEVFSPRKLQRALTFTDAEIEEQDIVAEMGLGGGMDLLRLDEDVSYWER